MKITAKFITLSLAILVVFFNTTLLGKDVKLLGKIEIKGEEEPLSNPWAFCVTDDELFIIPDYGAGNIKIYEKVYRENKEFLELIETVGRKGFSGPDALAKPTFCFYNKKESKFGVMDIGLRKIFIYDKVGRIGFERVEEVACWRGGADIQLIEDKLLISGYADIEPYDLYYIDLETGQTKFLLPSYTKYGLKSLEEYKAEYRGKSDIPAIGIRGWFDVYRDDIYFVWEGNLKVIRLNITNGDIDQNPFGEQTSHYKKPKASKELIAGYKRNFELLQSEREKISYVRNIFTTSKHVLIIYEGPVAQSTGSNFRLQYYTLDGEFLKEEPIPGKPNSKMWLDKDRKILYSLSDESRDGGRNYFILKYGISE